MYDGDPGHGSYKVLVDDNEAVLVIDEPHNVFFYKINDINQIKT